jgi:PAS domain-containing protein
MAYAMNVVLFRDLLERVPEGKAYTEDAAASGRRVFFDHGAVRTVRMNQCGQLPPGESAITRFLAPLGYRLNETYPLPRLKMMGRAYLHADLPEEIPQFFVSELHVEQFSPQFQTTTARVVANSSDPLDAADLARLQRLQATRGLPFADAVALLQALLRCFARQHAVPTLSDYEILLQESQEMAWIATEGNAFNHVTDRVPDLSALSAEQRQLGRSIKPQIEVAARGTMRQTAYRAAEVERVFRTPNGCVVRRVPGSFYEFISRDRVRNAQGDHALDLGFDSGNATAIFKMTATDGAVA